MLPSDAEFRSHVLSRLSYDPDTGAFRWLISGHGVMAGQEAGALHAQGDIRVKLCGKPRAAHRLAWLIVHGYWPTKLIDHKNGNRSDNRISNLREATNAQNSTNVRFYERNTSGYRGVSRTKNGKWCYQIQANGKRIKRSGFDTADVAHHAYIEHAILLHGEFAHPEQRREDTARRPAPTIATGMGVGR